MMRYQQINSTFIPRDDNFLNSSTDINPILILEKKNEELISNIELYENKINELEKELEVKRKIIKSSNDIIVALEKEIKNLKEKEAQHSSPNEKLNLDINNMSKENSKLKEQLAVQKEHAQLLYILILILFIW